MEYWAKVFSGAWDKTRHPLGWDRKKAAVVLVALGAAIATGLHFGWSRMISDATNLIWLAFPPAFAAVILFVWGIIETQYNLYADLAAQHTQLRHQTAARRRPNYAAVRLWHEYRLGQASRLWCDLPPDSQATNDSEAWYQALVAAIQRGELDFIETGDHWDAQRTRRLPDWNTRVTRQEFRRYATTIGEPPRFLRDND